MKKNIFIALCWLSSGLAQEVEIFGYYEPQVLAVNLEEDFFQLYSNKLRLDIQMNAGENVLFGANFDYITYHGKKNWAILEFLPDRAVNEVPDFQSYGLPAEPYQLNYNDRNFLDNAYVRLSFSDFDITVGKQQISLGTGYVWNPTDVFNTKDLIDPTYEQPGHNALRLDTRLLPGLKLMALLSPGEDGRTNDFLVRLKSTVAHFDFSLLYIEKEWEFTDFRLPDPGTGRFFNIDTKRRIAGIDLVGEIVGMGIWSEFAYNWLITPENTKKIYSDRFQSLAEAVNYTYPALKIREKFYEWVLGMDYTFDFQTYVMAEYYRNTFAGTDFKNYSLNDWLQLFFAQTRAISRDQAYIYLKHPLTDLMDLGISFIASLNDRSIALVPTLNYSLFQNIDISIFTNVYTGKKGTTYANQQGSGGFVRARVYF